MDEAELFLEKKRFSKIASPTIFCIDEREK